MKNFEVRDKLSQANTKRIKSKETLVYFDSLLHCDNHKLLWNVVSLNLFIICFYFVHAFDFDLICWLVIALSWYSIHRSNLGSKDFSEYVELGICLSIRESKSDQWIFHSVL